MFVYDTYEAGTTYGAETFEVTPELVAQWHRIYGGRPADDASAPAGIVILAQQRAYKNIIAPRPPGHMIGSQQIAVHGRVPVGARITTEVSCLSKEIRKERKWARMGFTGKVGDKAVYTSVTHVLCPM